MPNKPNHEEKQKFIPAHKGGATVSEAADHAGVSRTTVYKWRTKDPEFAKAFAEARDTLIEELEMEAYKRAIDGDDKLLILLLKAYKPKRYGDKPKAERGKASSTIINIAELAEKVRQWL